MPATKFAAHHPRPVMCLQRLLSLSLSLSLGAVPMVAAQNADAEYCARLADLTLRYLGKQQMGANKPDLETSTAIDRCQKGDTASGIPVLESKLRNGGITLPRR
jgi:hypothetical protein